MTTNCGTDDSGLGGTMGGLKPWAPAGALAEKVRVEGGFNRSTLGCSLYRPPSLYVALEIHTLIQSHGGI